MVDCLVTWCSDYSTVCRRHQDSEVFATYPVHTLPGNAGLYVFRLCMTFMHTAVHHDAAPLADARDLASQLLAAMASSQCTVFSFLHMKSSHPV